MVDLSTRYLGLALRSPIVASASPLNRDLDAVRRVDDAGVGAIVLPSLFEEEILEEQLGLNGALEAGSELFAEALDYFPAVPSLRDAGERYLEDLATIKSLVGVPVIGSLNATSAGGWARYAKLIEEAGADAIELNVYRVAADPGRSGAEMELGDLDVIATVRAELRIPLAVKLSPYYSALSNFAGRAVHAGADGLVLFNRFYQPDLDLETLDVVPRIDLSHPWELRLPLRWIAILRPQLDLAVSLAASSGIANGTDVVKAVMVGADVAMMTSSLLRHGPGHARTVEVELRRWMDDHDYTSVTQMRGSASSATAGDPSAFERANYRKTLHSWTADTALPR